MSKGVAEPGETVLDNLAYLAEGRTGNKTPEQCRALVSYILDKLDVSSLQPPEAEIVVRAVLENVAARARAEANSRLQSTVDDIARDHVSDADFQVAAAGELLDLKYNDSEFASIQRLYCAKAGQSWESLLRQKDNRGPGRVRSLRAGAWIDKSGKYARQKRRDLLQSFETALTAYLMSPDEATREEIARLLASAAADSEPSQLRETGIPEELQPDASPADPSQSVTVGASLKNKWLQRLRMRYRRWREWNGSWSASRAIVFFLVMTALTLLTMTVPLPATTPVLGDIYFWLDWPRCLLWQLPIVLVVTMGLAATDADDDPAEGSWSARLQVWLERLVDSLRFGVVIVFGLLVLFAAPTVEGETSQAPHWESVSFDKSVESFDAQAAQCPSATRPNLGRALPFSSCEISGGALHARMLPNPSEETMGVYPAADQILNTFDGTSPLRYYIITSFQAERYTPIGVCGLSIEADTDTSGDAGDNARSLFLHLNDDGQHQYDPVAEILATHISPNPEPTKPLDAATVNRQRLDLPQRTVLATGKPHMSFLLRPSLIGPSYGEWTKLSVLIDGDNITMYVDDREVTTAKYPGLRVMYRVSVGMLAPRQAVADDFACDFDYLQVKKIPATVAR